MELLSPRIAMLDEIDSGLDVDALNVVAKALQEQQARGAGLLMISHYARLLDMVKPSRAAILVNGKIAVEGGPELITRVDQEGYEWIKTELGIEIEKEVKNTQYSNQIKQEFDETIAKLHSELTRLKNDLSRAKRDQADFSHYYDLEKEKLKMR